MGKRPGRWRINASVEPPQPKGPWKGPPSTRPFPGHHLQIAIAQEREKAHPITRTCSPRDSGRAGLSMRAACGRDGLYSSDFYKFGDLGEQALRQLA